MSTGPTVKQELVPLGVAAAYAYFQLTRPQDRVESSEGLEKILKDVAIALSTVAPIFKDPGSRGAPVALTPAEIVATVFQGRERDTWDGLVMLEADLKTAIKTLRQVRMAFGPPR